MGFKYSREDICEKIKRINPNIEMTDEIPYTGVMGKAKFRCLVEGCGYEWVTSVESVCRGTGCKMCSWRKHGWRSWTDDELLDEARKYSTRGKFRIGSASAYVIALKRGLLDKCTWMKSPVNVYRDAVDTVYAYEFTNEHTVYVGRSFRIKDRDMQHRRKEDDPVFRFSVENGVAVPEMKILADGITVNEGRRLEHEFLNKYVRDGWTVLNRGKTGEFSGSLGALPRWTKGLCAEAAKTCATMTEFIHKHPGEYAFAKRTNIMDEMPIRSTKRKPYVLDEVKELIQTTKSCSEFKKKFPREYDWLARTKQLDVLSALPRKHHKPYDVDTIRQIMVECGTKKVFRENHAGAYDWVLSHKMHSLMDEVFPGQHDES